MDKNILDTINKGVNIASKMVSKGVGEVSKTIKPSSEAAKIVLSTGLFFRREENPIFGRFIPKMDFFEPQTRNKMDIGLLKNITLPQAEKAFILANQYLLLGKIKESIEKFVESTVKDPQLTDGYYMLGCLYLTKGDYRSSLENFKKAILLQQTLNKTIKRYLPSFKMTLNVTKNSCFTFFADLTGVNILLSLTARALGLFRDSVEILEQMLGVMPSHQVMLFFVACLYFESGAYDRVVEKLKDTVPDGNMGYLNLLILGRALLFLYDTETAREIFRKGLNKEEMDPEIYADYRFSISLCESGGYSAQNREKVLESMPDYRDILERLGIKPSVTKNDQLLQQLSTQRNNESSSQKIEQENIQTNIQPGKNIQQEKVLNEKPYTVSSTPRLVSDDGKINITLESQYYTIGRENGEVIIDWDASASKSHARISKESNCYFIEDLGSTNGTWVNQFKISKKVLLNKGDQIYIGKTNFRFL